MRPLHRVSVAEALAWIDAATAALPIEDIALGAAAERVLAADLQAPSACPPVDCAAIDGHALRAEATFGAGSYNPLAVPAVVVEAGEALPGGADAVVPPYQVEIDDRGGVVLVEPVAAGAGVERMAAVARTGDVLAAAGTRLSARHIGLLASVGLARVPALRRPSVRLALAAAPRSGAQIDGNGPMLHALVERDGGVVIDTPFADAFIAGGDLVLVAGGTGWGLSDRAAAALAASGSLEIHGVALFPGETAGFGRTANRTPAILLPGAPVACLWAYELFAGRAIRRLGGRDPRLPYRCRRVGTAQKIVSAIGLTEICPVRLLAGGDIEPLASFAEAGMMPAAMGDGFVVVPAASEGYPAGSQLRAYFYEEAGDRAEIAP